jgi:glycosyltransferase involved in cell wall biosynthesis
VIVPFLDPPRAFFREALAGVRAQSWTDWEMILVDDGSGPDAREVAEAAARDSARIRVVESGPERPAGISGARNAGLRHARGEFVALLDSDDVWLPEHLERHVAAYRVEPRAEMVCTDALYWSSWREGAGEGAGEGPDFLPGADAPAGLFDPPDFAVELIRGRVPVPCPTSVTVRRTVLEQIGGHEAAWTSDRRMNSMYEDQVFYVKLASRHPVLRLPVVFERYRLHGGSVTGSASAGQEREARRRFLAWCADVCAPELTPASGRRVRSAVRQARWRLRHPVLASWIRRGRKLMLRRGGERVRRGDPS